MTGIESRILDSLIVWETSIVYTNDISFKRGVPSIGIFNIEHNMYLHKEIQTSKKATKTQPTSVIGFEHSTSRLPVFRQQEHLATGRAQKSSNSIPGAIPFKIRGLTHLSIFLKLQLLPYQHIRVRDAKLGIVVVV